MFIAWIASRTEEHIVTNDMLSKLTQICLSIKFEEKLVAVDLSFPKGNVNWHMLKEPIERTHRQVTEESSSACGVRQVWRQIPECREDLPF